MKDSMLQKRSLGIQGTYANARHHAKKLVPLLCQIQAMLEDPENGLPEDLEWVQGHNVHLLKHRGRTFVLRPYHDGTDYTGLSLGLRVSRSVEVTLATVVHNEPTRYRLDFLKLIEFLLVSYREEKRRAKSED